jgi:hypothetical protein
MAKGAAQLAAETKGYLQRMTPVTIVNVTIIQDWRELDLTV